MKIAGIDIGGANLKFALVDARSSLGARSIAPATKKSFEPNVKSTGEVSFPFWTDHHDLVATLVQIGKPWRDVDGVAITMTAELADCFENKRQGVHFIVDAVRRAFPQTDCRFYTTTGELVDANLAKQNWAITAASNWHASAWHLFRQHKLTDGFLIDIGSTTCDLIPVKAGLPVVPGQTDLDRLRNNQLVYAGIGRTAICSLIDSVQLANGKVTVARELFATVTDAMTWTDRLAPQPNNCNSADGRPLTRSACRARLCRMLCADNEDLKDDQVTAIAEQTCAALEDLIVKSLRLVVDQHPALAKTFCLAGSGQSLARRAIGRVLADRPQPTIIGTAVANQTGQAVPAIAVAMKWLAGAARKQ